MPSVSRDGDDLGVALYRLRLKSISGAISDAPQHPIGGAAVDPLAPADPPEPPSKAPATPDSRGGSPTAVTVSTRELPNSRLFDRITHGKYSAFLHIQRRSSRAEA